MKTDCGNGLVSYGKRRRRSLNETEIPLLYKEIMEEVPLQLSITVRVIDLQKNETKLTPNLGNYIIQQTRNNFGTV